MYALEALPRGITLSRGSSCQRERWVVFSQRSELIVRMAGARACIYNLVSGAFVRIANGI